MRRHKHTPTRRLVLMTILAGALLAGCSLHEVGQTFYNTGEAYCRHSPDKCDAGAKP